jgi:hypothetical protein
MSKEINNPGYLSLALSRFHRQRSRAPLLNTDKRKPRCFLGVVIGINSQRLAFVRRLKEISKPLLFPTERLHNERYERRDSFASVRPYLSSLSMRLSRLPCRGAGYGVVVGIGLFFSVFMLGLTWIQVSLFPKQIGLDIDYGCFDRPDIRLSHQRTPKVRRARRGATRPSNSCPEFSSASRSVKSGLIASGIVSAWT